MSEILKNYVGGEWIAGRGDGTPLRDPVTGEELARVSSEGLDLDKAFDFARTKGGTALRDRTYAERAALLGDVAKALQAKRDDYYAISIANSGTTKADSGMDIEGAIFTLSYYAKLGASLGDAKVLLDGDVTSLSKDGSFRAQHILTPTRGLALFINAFNFPAWGLWEKAAPALLSGVPVIIKPATATAWLTQRMVADVIAAGVLPEGALSVVCGSAAGLLDRVQAFDVVSFTGSADTAAKLRAHPAFVSRAARLNIEADSLNSALLGLDASPGSGAFDGFISEVAREMTIKSGQKCTAIRRAFVPAAHFDAAAEALRAKLAKITVGNPRNETVRMGSLVSRDQHTSVKAGIDALRRETELLFDGSATPLVDADPEVSACVAPHLLGLRDGEASAVHDVEVFGPVATLIAYRDEAHAIDLARRGGGSLVASVFSDDEGQLAHFAVALADTHGRVHAVSPAVAKTQTGHGNVMPQSLHGGPGRAGGGEELGGLRALNFYHRRAAIQAPSGALDLLPKAAAK
ncbi:3,4-dehydroadipyl-CoA semialdehyde dehydrogenase [Chondromyces crocatus]|uniref:Aldehyde dehydrogenase n=1 Tax=Chondromyces crocatus TaxID=52 RepID=A0A0K1ECX6_CHOCO|nr:3,4-dehydroadipyl-CoA semialdehyde dehydrogenase [Chondromyces crocatus]AKT38428.1 aldehyde dehydrogenase [Chondromyces crocatus]